MGIMKVMFLCEIKRGKKLKELGYKDMREDR